MDDDQKRLFAGQKWMLAMHMSCEDRHILNHRCEALGLTRSTVTPKTAGQFGKPDVTYFLDGDRRQYKTLAAVATALIDSGKFNVVRFPAETGTEHVTDAAANHQANGEAT